MISKSRNCTPLIVCSLILSLTCSAMVGAQGVFSKYFRDEERRSVNPGLTLVEGTTRNGKAYMTEKEAILMALRHNLDINVERHNYLFDERIIDQRKSIYDPNLTFGLNWDRETTPTASILEGGTKVTNILTTYNWSYRQKFSSGSSLEANLHGLRTLSTSFFASLVPAINTSFEVLFRQNLLEGFGRIAADYEIEISRNNLEITEQEFKRTVTDLILEVLDRYWELSFAVQDIEVKQKSSQLAKTVLAQNKARFEVGTVARLQVVEAQAEVASRREELIASQFAYRQVQDQLIKLITNYEDPRQFPGEVVPADQVYTPPKISEPFERLQSIALEQRPEIQQAELETLNQRVNLKVSRDRLKPTLDMVLGYKQFGLGGRRRIVDFSRGFTDPRIIEIIEGGLGNSLSQLFASDFFGYTLALNLELPISNTDARAQNAQAQIALDRLELRTRSVSQSISLEIRDALTRIEGIQARLEASQAAVRFAGERLEGEQARFDVGMGTTRELIEAQRDFLQAESVSLRAQIDLIKSHHELDRALGQTFDRHTIQLVDALNTNVK